LRVSIENGTIKPQFVAQGGNIISGGGGNIVSGGASNIVSAGAGNIISTGILGSLAGSGEAPGISGGFGTSPIHLQAVNTAADLAKGSSTGMFVAHGSGGSDPVITVTQDPETGEPVYTAEVTLDDTSNPSIKDVQGLAFTFALNAPVIQFAANNVTVDEAAGQATVKVIRTGDTTGFATVQYATSDDTALERTNYTPAFGKLTFAPGETEKNIVIPIIDDAYGSAEEGAQNSFKLILGNQSGAAVMMPNVATITITNNDGARATANPLDNTDARFFVRQQYLDFLAREPDAEGFAYWTAQITQCGSNEACINRRKAEVSAAFFIELEFQQTGSVVYRMHRAAFGLLPGTTTRANVSYSQFVSDRSQLIGGTQLPQSTLEFANQFVQRAAFTQAYPLSLSDTDFVNKLFDTAGLTPFTQERQQQIVALASGKTRADALRAVIEIQAFKAREYNRAFVLMQYFGYLQRDPDQGGYDFWLNVLNNRVPGNYRSMVCAFINSKEYQQRFSPIATRTDSVCSQLAP